MTLGSIRFSPSILIRLGEELIPHPSQGIIELLKNAYDAEANTCIIELDNVLFHGGSIIVKDDGNGMTGAQLINNFLLIGSSEKKRKQKSDRLGRRFVGDKGLGRLAAIRLGTRASIRGRPRQEPGVEYRLDIDWEDFDRVESVEEVILEVIQQNTQEKSGVTIVIENLKQPLTAEEVKTLTREALLLSDPFAFVEGSDARVFSIPAPEEPALHSLTSADQTFRARIESVDFKEIQAKLQAGYLADAAFRLQCVTKEDGSGIFKLFDQTQKQIAQKDLPEGKFKGVALRFDLWVYLLATGLTFSPKAHTITEIRDWLNSVGGVHFYYRSLKVKPYGDPKDDWLNINLSRSQNQENRPSTNTIFGRVAVDDVKSRLTQPTSRMGFLENKPFLEVVHTAREALDWMYQERSRLAEKDRLVKREAIKLENAKSIEQAEREVKRLLRPPEAAQIMKVINRLAQADAQATKVIEEDLQMYRSLATIGTTFTIYAHQAEQPASAIKSMAGTIKERGEKYMPQLFDQHIRRPIDSIADAAEGIRSYTKFPLEHLDKSKRRTSQISVSLAWGGVIEMLEPIASKSSIAVELQKIDKNDLVYGSVALFEAIAANLITNSIKALREERATRQRLIKITISSQGNDLCVTHGDNGPGISGLSLEEIWLPGRTTYESGTGFGLTIVRDSVRDLGGSVNAKEKGSLGGAEFIMKFPLMR